MFLFHCFCKLCFKLSILLFYAAKRFKKDFLRILFCSLKKNNNILCLWMHKIIPRNSNISFIPKLFCNEGDVTVSGYNLMHPQTQNIVILLETTKKDPKKVLLETLSSIKKKNTEFKTQFAKAMK